MDMFHLKNKKEVEDMLSEFWSDCEYLVKVRILLKIFEGYSITKLEARNINKLWESLSVEKKKDIYQNQHRYSFSQI